MQINRKYFLKYKEMVFLSLDIGEIQCIVVVNIKMNRNVAAIM